MSSHAERGILDTFSVGGVDVGNSDSKANSNILEMQAPEPSLQAGKFQVCIDQNKIKKFFYALTNFLLSLWVKLNKQ